MDMSQGSAQYVLSIVMRYKGGCRVKHWHIYKWLLVAALGVVVLIGSIAWFNMSIYDLPRIRSASGCSCGGIVLEDEVRDASSIYSGRVTRISRNLDGTYRVFVQPEHTFKGAQITASTVQYTVHERCPYPFQKDHRYTFIQASDALGGTLDECSTVINLADIETMDSISQWLKLDATESDIWRNKDTNPNDGKETEPNTVTGETSESGAELIYHSLKTQLGSIRVEEEGYKTWLYDSTERLFFYSPAAKISFFVPLDRSITVDDFERFAKGISVSRASDGKLVPYALGEVSVDVRELPIVIKLFEAPNSDIVIRFASPTQDDVLEVPVTYVEPFTYTVFSRSDSALAEYAELLRQGYQAPYYVLNGQIYQMTIRFNHPVDRGSVYEKINEHMQTNPLVAWSLQWMSDYEVRLSLAFDDDMLDPVSFSLSGLRTEDGYKLVTRERFIIQPTEPQRFSAIDLETNTKEAYFTTITKYDRIDVSPNGSYVLTGIQGSNGTYNVYMYQVRDRFGNQLRSFGMNEIRDPVWVDDGILAFVTDRELKLYQVAEDVISTVWETPSDRPDESIVSLSYSNIAGKLAVGSRYTTYDGSSIYDLYIFDDLADQEPLILEAFGTHECAEGECAARSIYFADTDHIVYSRYESIPGQAEGYIPVLYMTNLDDLSTKRVELTASYTSSEHTIHPLNDGRILLIANLSADSEASHEPDKERWVLYHPVTGTYHILFDTYMGLFTEYWLDDVILAQDGKILVSIYDRGWYMLDPVERTIQLYPVLSKQIDVIDVEMNRIWLLDQLR
jgi:hypothetical protein